MRELTLEMIEATLPKRPKTTEANHVYSQHRAMIHLKTISLSNKNITNVSALKILVNLQTCFLYDNQLTDISGITKNIRNLYLQNNNISNFECFKDMNNLVLLNLSNNKISIVTKLNNASLETLHLDNQMTSNRLEFEQDCFTSTNIQTLFLANNKITDCCGIINETVETLYLSGNKISSIESLVDLVSNCTALKTLEFNDNPLQCIKLRQKLVEASKSLVSINGKTVGDFERLYTSRINANKKPVKVIQQKQEEKELIIPHLPNYPSQYRDLIKSFMKKEENSAKAAEKSS